MAYSHQIKTIVPIFLVILVSVLSSELLGEVINSKQIKKVNEVEEYGYKAYPTVRHAMLKEYEPEYEKFRGIQIGDRIVYFRQRTIGDAIVQEDQIVYHFDKHTRGLLDVKVHWRDDLPAKLPKIMSKKDVEAMVEGRIRFSQLFYIAPDSYVFPIKPAPKNPCWIIESINDNIVKVTVIDAVEGKKLGYGVPPPFEAFCMGGEGYGYC